MLPKLNDERIAQKRITLSGDDPLASFERSKERAPRSSVSPLVTFSPGQEGVRAMGFRTRERVGSSLVSEYNVLKEIKKNSFFAYFKRFSSKKEVPKVVGHNILRRKLHRFPSALVCDFDAKRTRFSHRKPNSEALREVGKLK